MSASGEPPDGAPAVVRPLPRDVELRHLGLEDREVLVAWLTRAAYPLSLVPGTEPFVDSTSVEFLGVPGPAMRVEVAPSRPPGEARESITQPSKSKTRRGGDHDEESHFVGDLGRDHDVGRRSNGRPSLWNGQCRHDS